jgi:hypothetical protein
MQLNTLILGQSATNHPNSYALELEHRLPGLQELYQEHCAEPAADRYRFGQIAGDYIARGGQIHYAIDDNGQVVGSAYVLSSNSLLQNMWPVDRFFVAKALDSEERFAIAKALLSSLTEAATAETAKRPDSIWLQVLVPNGALTHPESQPVYGALEASGFRGVGINDAELWVRFIPHLN